MQVRTLALPAFADEDSPIGDTCRAVHDLVARANDAVYGEASPVLTPESSLLVRRGTSAESVVTLTATVQEQVVGVSDIFLPQTESTDTADTMLFVDPDLPEAVRSEVFETLVDASIRHARAIGRTAVLGGGEAQQDGPVPAETGHGAVSPSDPESAAWLRRGAVLAQVYRSSWLQLARLDDLQERLEAATASAPDYRPITWAGETPTEHRADMRLLHERMSTDSPTGSLGLEAQEWSDARLTEFEQHKIGAGRQLLTAAVEHTESGRLVGYTQLVIADDPLARQHNLIVLREHRGHGLGRLLKLTGLRQLQRAAPHATAVSTMNAAENLHMLRVNDEVGFTTVAHLAVFRLGLGS